MKDKKDALVFTSLSVLLGLVAQLLYSYTYGIASTKSIWMFSEQSLIISKYVAWAFPGFVSALIVGCIFCFSIGYFFRHSYFSLSVFLLVLMVCIAWYLSNPLRWLHLLDWSVMIVIGLFFCFLGVKIKQKMKNKMSEYIS